MDGEPPQEEDFSTIPLVERSTHKVSQLGTPNSHANVHVGRRRRRQIPMYIPPGNLLTVRTGRRACRHTTRSSPRPARRRRTRIPSSGRISTAPFCELSTWLQLTRSKSWCLDANAVAQEKGIEAALAIVTNSGETSAR